MKYENSKDVAILLAVYNGERYLEEQLESLYRQTDIDWTLYVRDDASTDNTLPIIERYQNKYGNIIVVEDEKIRLGAKNNFLRLLELVDSKYYMFTDADDVWLPIKVEYSRAKMLEVETEKKDVPVLIFTNMIVVDSGLRPITESYWDSIHFCPQRFYNEYYQAMIGFTSGATMFFNKKVKDVSFPVGKFAPMHDWWIGLCAFRYKGIVVGMETPTMLYRKHGGNVTGEFIASSQEKSTIKRLLVSLKENKAMIHKLRSNGCSSYILYFYYKMMIMLKRKNIL